MSKTWFDAAAVAAGIQKQLNTMEIVGLQDGRCFRVAGWPFAIMRNSIDSWNLLGPSGLESALTPAQLLREIKEQVFAAEADNAGWDFDPDEIDI